MAGSVVSVLRKKGCNARIILEGIEKKGAEDAMMRAGFTWYFGNKLVTIDHDGKRHVQKLR